MIVFVEGRKVTIKEPSLATLKKYGLTLDDWVYMFEYQGCVCAVCKKPSGSGRYYIDHFHVQGFRKMKDENKKKYCRGILCYMCNRFYVAKGITVEKAKNVVTYLENFERRKPK